MASIKDLKRLCSFYIGCIDCPIKSEYTCSVPRFPDNADEIIDKWVAEHPIKTYAMDFFNKFPNAQRLKSGVPEICIERVYNVAGIDESYRDPKCEECWNREMKEDTGLTADVQPVKCCRMIPLESDCRGYTDVFICTNCHQHIHLGFIRKEYSGSYCLECGAEVEDGASE